MANTACSTNIPRITSAFITKEGNEILSAMKASRYVDYINVLFGRVFSEEYINNNSYTTLSDFTDDNNKLTVNGNLINLYNKVKDQLRKDMESGFYDSLPMSTVNDLLKIIQNWDLFINYHSGYNAFISINDDNFSPEEKEAFDKKGNEYSEFELVSNEVRTLFKFLPRAEFVTDTRGNVKIQEAYDPSDGLPLISDYENVFKLTLDALKGIKDETKFIEILTSEDLLKKIPELNFLFQILPVKDGGVASLLNKQRLLFNSFYTTFSRDYIPVHASTRKVDEEGEKVNSHFRYKSTKGNFDKIFRQFTSNFASNQEENEYVKFDNSEDERSPERAGYGRKRLYSLPNKSTLNGGKKIELTDEDINKLSIGKIQSQYKEHFDFFKIFGIEFSDLSLLKSYKDKMNLIKILNSTLTIHDNISKRLDLGYKIFSPIIDLSDSKSRINYQDTDGKFKIVQSLRNTIKDIVKFEAIFSKVSPTIMSKSASGEKQSDISYSNALSIAANQISTVNSLSELYQKSYFKKLMYNPLHKGSWVTNNVIGTNNRYAIENYSGHVIETGEDTLNSDTKSLSDIDKFKSDFSNLMGWGIINTPQLESKSGYFALKFLNENEQAIVPFPIINFENGFLSNNTKFFGQILSYLQGELQRIRDYNSTLRNVSYDVPEAYGQLHIFKDMISDEQLSYLLNNEWDENSSVIQEIKPNIEKYFQDQFLELNNFIAKNKITDLVTQQALTYQGLTLELYQESPQVYQDLLLRTFIANDFVHNVEFGIFMSGDPLFYKDWHKRLGGLASTGVQPSNTQNLRHYFNSDSEKLYWDNYSLRGILNQEEESPVQRRDNFDVFLSAVLNEDTISEDTAYHSPQILVDYVHSVQLKTGQKISLQQAEQDLKTNGLKIDVGDGQGYLNMDAHRELSIKQDTYRPQHDVSYKYEALTFKKDILGKELSESEKILFIKLQNQIIKNPEKYALPILKQTYYGTLANENIKLDAKVFDKFSLAPLLPSIAKNHPELKKLLVVMATRQIHYVKYKSGTKGYVKDTFSVDDLYNEKRELDELQSELLKLQITPSKKEKTSTKIPTQMIKLIFTNLFDKGKASENTIKLRDEFISNLNKIQSTNKKYVLNKLGFETNENGDIQSWNREKIVSRIINQINIQKLPSNLLEALQINSKGEFSNTIESSGVYQQLLNYVVGKLDSSLREFKVNGGDFVLLSESMFSNPLKYFTLSKDKSSIVPLECRITLTKEFSKLLNVPDPKNLNKKIGTIDRLNELLKDNNFRKKYQKELLVTFSRPPVQGPNSMGVGTVVEFFFPTAGNILQLPKEFMHQAGIDFDYDKEKVLISSLSSDGVFLDDENIQSKLTELENEYSELREIFAYVDEYVEESESYEEMDDFESLKMSLLSGDSFTKLLGKIFNVDVENLNDIPENLAEIENKALEYLSLKYANREINNNGLLKSVIASLQIPELFSEIILPNTDSLVKPLAEENGKDINNINTLPIGNSVYSYFKNLNVFKMFNDAKALLGPFALQNTFSQLIAPLNVNLNLDYAYNKDGKPSRMVNNLLLNNKDRQINISAREDENGQNKQQINSQFINATVDSAKDPYFANFMLSFDNISTFMFLFNMGYPIQTIVDFTSSAIVRKYLDVKEKNPFLKSEELVQLTLKEANLPFKKGMSLDELMKIDSEQIYEDNSTLLSKLKELKKDSSLLEEALSQEGTTKNHKLLLINFVAMEQHAKQLSAFKGLFKNDTNKVGSIFEIFSKNSSRNSVIASGMFNEEDIVKIENSSTITAFRNDDIIEEVLKNVFPIVSEDKIVKALGNLFVERKTSLNDNDSRILSQIITNDYIGSILFSYGFYKNQSIYEYAKDLIRKKKNEQGEYNKTLLERIHKFKQNKEYPDLLESFSVLGKIVGDVSPKAIKGNPVYDNKFGFNVLLDVDPNIPLIQKENYMNQFKQIIEGDFETRDPLVKDALVNFVKDFFIAGLIQTGFNKTGISFLEYIPIRFTQELLNPALDFYNFEITNNPQNFDIFLKEFNRRFKQNNSNYFYLTKEERKDSTKESYKGKVLRVVAYPDESYLNYNNPLIGIVDTDNSGNPIDVIEQTNEQNLLVTSSIPSSNSREFIYQNKAIVTEFVLGEQQTEALKKLIDFVKSTSEDVITLQGAAGTGKTSIIGYLQKYLGKKYSFAYLAPTHAATAELAFSTAKTGNTVLPATLQSAVTLNSFTKKHVFTQKIQKRLLGLNPIIVLDEASMIDKGDVNNLIEAADDIGAKIIFLGDEKQISKVVTGNIDSKAVSPAFTDFDQINLTKIFRQSNNKLLSLLSMMRQQTDFKLFKVENSDNVKFLDKKQYNKELIADLESNPENTIVISYTNNSVKGINNSSRAILGRTGQTQIGDIVIGYLGYASKQIEKSDVANSVSYTIKGITENGSVRGLTVASSKLGKLIELGIESISSTATTNYYQLSTEDSLTFDNLKAEDYEKNNVELSKVFRRIYEANEQYRQKVINYATYLGLLQGFSDTLRKYSVGNDYVFNPTTDRMEKYDNVKHKNIKTNGQGSLLINKDIDYGHAITIHKSQGSTIDNVYFDSSSLKAAQNTPIVDTKGNKVTTEKQSLAYVAMSRSKNKLIVYEGDNEFEQLAEEKTEEKTVKPEIIQPSASTNNEIKTSKVINIYSTDKNGFQDLSNMISRPFRYNFGASYTDFDSVEQAYQAAKYQYTDQSQFNQKVEEDILDSKNGFEAKQLGRKFKGLDQKAWDENSSRIMKNFLLESFKQNPDALQKLLSTGNAQLTHTQDKGKWAIEFPRLLMEVRDELSNKPVSSQDVSLKPILQAEYTNHSGGAYGGDTYWDIIGREFGFNNHNHYKDAGNAGVSQKLKNSGVTATILTKEEMDIARAEVEKLLGKKYPDTLQGNLQVRNYYQVAKSDAVFAIASLNGDAKFNTGSVLGGTNTAVQLAIVLDKPVYVWDTSSEKWFKYNPTSKEFELTDIPILTKDYAGVGTRNIENYNTLDKTDNKWKPRKEYLGEAKEEAAKQAIRDVYKNTIANINNKEENPIDQDIEDIINQKKEESKKCN